MRTCEKAGTGVRPCFFWGGEHTSDVTLLVWGASQFMCEAVQPSDFSRPFGTRDSRNQRDPRLESLGYSRMSLRDIPKSEMCPLVLTNQH